VIIDNLQRLKHFIVMLSLHSTRRSLPSVP
jgi:hypothetical protein